MWKKSDHKNRKKKDIFPPDKSNSKTSVSGPRPFRGHHAPWWGLTHWLATPIKAPPDWPRPLRGPRPSPLGATPLRAMLMLQCDHDQYGNSKNLWMCEKILLIRYQWILILLLTLLFCWSNTNEFSFYCLLI